MGSDSECKNVRVRSIKEKKRMMKDKEVGERERGK
jgi:hypothetical protein